MIPAILVAVAITFGTLLWLILLLGSTLFPPKRGSEMRVAEKALVLVSAILLVLWVVMVMASSVIPSVARHPGGRGSAFPSRSGPSLRSG